MSCSVLSLCTAAATRPPTRLVSPLEGAQSSEKKFGIKIVLTGLINDPQHAVLPPRHHAAQRRFFAFQATPRNRHCRCRRRVALLVSLPSLQSRCLILYSLRPMPAASYQRDSATCTVPSDNRTRAIPLRYAPASTSIRSSQSRDLAGKTDPGANGRTVTYLHMKLWVRPSTCHSLRPVSFEGGRAKTRARRASGMQIRGPSLEMRPAPRDEAVRRGARPTLIVRSCGAASRTMRPGSNHPNVACTCPNPWSSMTTRSPASSQMVLTRLPVSTICPACRPLPSATR